MKTANGACESKKTKGWRRWSQFHISTLLLVTLITGVACGWWVDRQKYVPDNAILTIELRETTCRETSLHQQLTFAKNIRELVRVLDSNQENEKFAIDLLLSLNGSRLHDSKFALDPASFSREILLTTSDKQLELVIGHMHITGAGWSDSVALLLERTTEDFGGSLVTKKLRVVDCLVRHSFWRLSGGEQHSISYADRDGDGQPEVIFDIRSSTSDWSDWSESFQPTPDGFVQQESNRERESPTETTGEENEGRVLSTGSTVSIYCPDPDMPAAGNRVSVMFRMATDPEESYDFFWQIEDGGVLVGERAGHGPLPYDSIVLCLHDCGRRNMDREIVMSIEVDEEVSVGELTKALSRLSNAAEESLSGSQTLRIVLVTDTLYRHLPEE